MKLSIILGLLLNLPAVVSRVSNSAWAEGSDLGLGVVANKQDTLDAKPLVLDATGVPLSWDGTALRSFMTDQGWQGVDFFPEKRC